MYVPIADFLMFLALFAAIGFLVGLVAGRLALHSPDSLGGRDSVNSVKTLHT